MGKKGGERCKNTTASFCFYPRISNRLAVFVFCQSITERVIGVGLGFVVLVNGGGGEFVLFKDPILELSLECLFIVLLSPVF